MSKSEIIKKALVAALEVAGYVTIVAWLMSNGERLFGPGPDVLAGIAVLMLFVLSAAVVGLAIFGRPVIMYLEGQKRDAIMLLSSTVIWLLVLTAVFLLTLTLIK